MGVQDAKQLCFAVLFLKVARDTLSRQRHCVAHIDRLCGKHTEKRSGSAWTGSVRWGGVVRVWVQRTGATLWKQTSPRRGPEAYVVPGVSLIFLFFLLSDVQWMQSMALRLRKIKIHLGSFSISLQGGFLLISVCRLVFEIMSVQRTLAKLELVTGSDQGRTSPAMYDRLRGMKWRGERNFWICVFGVILWLLVIRISALISYFDKALESAYQANKSQVAPRAPEAKTQPSSGIDVR